jgi:shikimate dehydrogenase
MRITARTRVFALLGDPVSHSLSPRMQTAGFHAAGLDAVYIALQPRPEHVESQMATLVQGGGGGNVTIPYKQVVAFADGEREARVEALGSANVFGGIGGALQLRNTDVDGILAGLDMLGAGPEPWCIIGTGGSARAAVGAAVERGVRVAVKSRDAARAEGFREWAASLGVGPAEFEECRAVINATPRGLAPGDAHPVEPAAIPRGAVVLDLVYVQPGETAWVRACRDRGLQAADGREVLLAQGAASWQLWFPGVAPPVEIMRAALDGRLG